MTNVSWTCAHCGRTFPISVFLAKFTRDYDVCERCRGLFGFRVLPILMFCGARDCEPEPMDPEIYKLLYEE